MGAECTRIIEFFSVVFSNWILLLGGAVMIALGVLERIFRKEVHWRLFTAIVVALLFIAFYMSWRDMRVTLDAKPSKSLPEINVNEKDPEARQKLTEQQVRIEELQSQLGNANETIRKLQSSLPPENRSLSSEQKSSLVAALRQYGSFELGIRNAGTQESQDYADQLKDAL